MGLKVYIVTNREEKPVESVYASKADAERCVATIGHEFFGVEEWDVIES